MRLDDDTSLDTGAVTFDRVPMDDRPRVAGAGGSRLPLVYVVGADGVIESKHLGEGALDAALREK